VSGIVHLEDELTSLNGNLFSPESRAVSTESPIVALYPAAVVEGVKVVLPMEIEAVSSSVVGLHFDVFVLGGPGHSGGVEVVAPSFESGSPEVHHKLLGFVLEVLNWCSLSAAYLSAVNRPGDVLRCPCNHVCVPIITWLEVGGVAVVLSLVCTDDVH